MVYKFNGLLTARMGAVSYLCGFDNAGDLFLLIILFASTAVSNFPASGHRGIGEGGFVNVSTNGFCWPSSSYGLGSLSTRCGLLNTNVGNVNPLNNGNRYAGCPVRCVQELIGICGAGLKTLIEGKSYKPGVLQGLLKNGLWQGGL